MADAPAEAGAAAATESASASPATEATAATARATAKEEEPEEEALAPAATPASAAPAAVDATAAPIKEEVAAAASAAVGKEVGTASQAAPAEPLPYPHQHHDLHALAEAARTAKAEGARRLQEFEGQRKAYFGPQIRSNATHWQAFTATLQRAQAENERVLDFFGKRLAVEQFYCDKLRELPYEDLKGGGGGGGWWSKGGAHHHHRKGPAVVSSPGRAAAASTKASSDPKKPLQQQPQELAALRAHYRERRVALPAMEELVGSIDALVARHDEYVADTRKELVEGRLKPLTGGFRATSDGILAEGSQALENVQRAEQHVQQAYADLARSMTSLHPASTASPAAGGGAPLEDGADWWLADMQYRVAVELQNRVWATAQAQLGALFGRMKTLEMNRRQQLHALILRFMQNQGGFWGQLPQLAADSALRISGLAPSDPQEVESALAEEIRAGAKAAEEREQEAASKKAGKGTAATAAPAPSASGASQQQLPMPPPPTTATPSAAPFTGSLRSPLESPLVKRAEVLEHKLVTGMESLPLLKRWRPTLAVLTLDNALHLFDLPAVSTAAEALSPKEAFRALVPQPLDSKGRFRKVKEAERIKPTASLVLDRSKARFRPEEGDRAFEVTESTASVGIAKVFKSHETRRVILRAKSQASMVDWCVIVNGEEHAA